VPFLRRWMMWGAVRIGALVKPGGRKRWLRDSWRVIPLLLLALPIVGPPALASAFHDGVAAGAWAAVGSCGWPAGRVVVAGLVVLALLRPVVGAAGGWWACRRDPCGWGG
jgi:hypothetical protein